MEAAPRALQLAYSTVLPYCRATRPVAYLEVKHSIVIVTTISIICKRAISRSKTQNISQVPVDTLTAQTLIHVVCPVSALRITAVIILTPCVQRLVPSTNNLQRASAPAVPCFFCWKRHMSVQYNATEKAASSACRHVGGT